MRESTGSTDAGGGRRVVGSVRCRLVGVCMPARCVSSLFSSEDGQEASLGLSVWP